MFEKAEDNVDDHTLGQFSWCLTGHALGLEHAELRWWNEVLILHELLKLPEHWLYRRHSEIAVGVDGSLAKVNSLLGSHCLPH